MKYTGVLALALAFLAAMFLSGMRAQAQQEVDPTNYPLTPAVAHTSHPPIPRAVKQTSAHHTQHSTAKKAQKPSASSAHRDAAKTVAKR